MTGLAQDRRQANGRPGAAWRSGPFGVRNFRLLGAGQLTSTVGDFCYAVALPWLILSGHGSTVLLGAVLACYGVPRTVLIPLGGALADKLSPRQVMLVADSVRCVLVAILAVFAAHGILSLAFLGPVAAVLGAGEGVFLPSAAAIMPSLLAPEMLQAGNGLNAALVQGGSLAGPVLGGILVTTIGPAPAFGVDAASFAVSALALAMMRPARAETAGPADAGPELAADPVAGDGPQPDASAGDGVVAPETSLGQLFRRSRELQVIVMVAALANFVIAGTFEVALPSLAHARFGAAGYGALIACFGIGGLAGTLLSAKLTGLRRPAVASCVAFMIGALAVAVVPFLGGLPGAAATLLIFGTAGMFGNVLVITLLQLWAPPQLLGRVMSLVMLASIGTYPVSVALSGVVVRHLGPGPFFPAAGGLLGLAVVLALTQRAFRVFGAAPEPAGAAEVAAAGAA
jgi:MFS family permease